jgi:hypothetical protein
MLTKIKSIMSRIDRFPTLGDIFDKNNQLNIDVLQFLEVFSQNKGTELVSFIEYGILQEVKDREVNDKIQTKLYEKRTDEISNYLCEDGLLAFPIGNNHSYCRDYLKSEKRKDLILKINIVDRNPRVLVFNYPDLKFSSLIKFTISCDCIINKKRKNNIDLVENYNKLGPDDEILIHGTLIPREPFDYKYPFD